MNNNNITDYPRYVDKELINYIDENVRASESDFDSERFNEWLIENNVESKNNPSAYIKACFKKEFERGTFRPRAKVSYVPNTQRLINELRDRGICVLADDSVWLSVVWKHLVNWKEINIKDCVELNHKILEYMGESQSFEDYKRLLMNSKTLKKYEINWNLLEEKVKFEILGWDNYLKELEIESEE